MIGPNKPPSSQPAEEKSGSRNKTPDVLRRSVTSSTRDHYVPFLDGLRGVAVLFVLVFHAWHVAGHPLLRSKIPPFHLTVNFTKLIENGWVGVDFFFVLSAFLLSQHWLRADYLGQPRPSLKTYWRHRFFRIVPAYYVCLFLMLLFLCPLLISPSVVYSAFGLKYLGAHLLFLQFLTPITSASYGINGSFWTLTLEMIFYLLLPWGVLPFLRKRWLIAMPLVITANMFWFYLTRNHLDPLVNYAQSLIAFQVDSSTIRFYLARQFLVISLFLGSGSFWQISLFVIAWVFYRHACFASSRILGQASYVL